MSKILVVDDDVALANIVKDRLEAEKHIAETSFRGEEAVLFLESFEYDLVILDWDLPDLSGIEICRSFRARGGTTPILILTGKQSAGEIEAGLDAGADDYLTKPFEQKVLAARVRALLRRPSTFQGQTLTWADVVLDTRTHTVTRGGEAITLPRMEYTVLEFFMRHRDQAFSTETIMRRCWEGKKEIGPESIYTCIRRIRKALDLEGRPSIIRTVHAVGYKHESFDLE